MKKLIMMCISLSSMSLTASVLRETNYYENYLYSNAGEGRLVEGRCHKDLSTDDISNNKSSCKNTNSRHVTLIRKEMDRFHLSFYGVHRCYDQYSDSEYQNYTPLHLQELLEMKDSEKEIYESLLARGYEKKIICLEMEKVADELKPGLIEKMMDTETVHHIGIGAIENSILDDADFGRSYTDIPCGTEGTIEEKIKSCSIYPESKRGDLRRVTNLESGETVFKNLVTENFWSNSIDSSDSFSSLVPHLWRTATANDQQELRADLREDFKYVSASPIARILTPYTSTLTNRKTGDKIIFDYRDEVADIYLLKKNGAKELIKTVSLSEYPVNHFGNRFHYSGYRRVRSISEGYYDLTSGMARAMDIGMFAFFPVTLTVYGVYSLSYGPAYLLDLIGPERRAVRKMDKLLRGISTKTGDKSFNMVLNTFEQSSLN